MAYYLQLDRYINDSLTANDIVTFEHETSRSMTDLADYETDPYAPPVLEDDFYIHEIGPLSGAVDLLKRGQYLIYYKLVPINNTPTTSETYLLQKLENDPILGEVWKPISSVNTQLFATASSGIHFIDYNALTPLTIALWQNSPLDLTLTNHLDVSELRLKGSLLIYGLSENDGDLSRIIEKIEDLENNCKTLDLDALECWLKEMMHQDKWQDERIYQLQLETKEFELEYDFLQNPSTLKEFQLRTPMDGIYINCMRSGHIYHFTVGRTTRQDAFNFKPGQAGTVILPSSDVVFQDAYGINYQPFSYLSATNPQKSWLIVKDNDGTRRFFNLFASNRGLYVQFNNNGWSISGNTIEFTMTLIMLPPS